MTIDASIPLQAGKGVAPIDAMSNAAKAYSLAGTMVETEKAIKDRNEGLHDEDALKNYLTGGGDLSTPEGSKKAISDLKDKISPQFYEKLLAHSDQVTNNFLKQKEMMAKLPGLYLEDMKSQEEQAAPMLEQMKKSYDTTLSSQGKAAADAEFEKNRQAFGGWMSQQQLGGQPRFTPDVTKSLSQLTPDSLPYFLAHTKYHTTLIDDRLKEAKIDATEGGKRTFYSDGKDEYMQNDRGVTMKNISGTWENVDVLPPNAKKIGTAGKDDANGGMQLTPGALATAAMTYAYDGPASLRSMPPGERTKIMNQSDQLRQAAGLSPGEWATVKYDVKAKTKALGNLENLEGQVDAFEKSLTSYSNRALENLDKISTTDVPWINRIVQNLDSHIEGLPPELAKLQVNLRAVASEYNKLSSGAMGNTQPGEKSLLEIMEMFKKSDNPDTLRATLGEVLQDGKFRASGIRETKAAVRESLTGLGEKKDTGSAPTSSSGSTRVSPTEQKAADSDRVKILRDEKAAALARVNAAKSEDEKRRAQGDVEALNKELRGAGASADDAPATSKKTNTKQITIGGKTISVQVD